MLELIKNISINIKKDIFDNFDQNTQQNAIQITTDIVQKYAQQYSDIKMIISKERKEKIIINQNGKYILTFVGIDNIDFLDLNFSLGSIFTIYEDNIEPNNIKYSAYATYGPTFQIVFADNLQVQFLSYIDNHFTQQEDFKLNQKGKINSTAGDVATFLPQHKQLIQSLFDEGYRLRFSDSLVLDTHQILFKKGGLYSSPITKKDPNGKVTLVFEAFAIASIVTKIGGYAINDKHQDILSIKIQDNIDKTTALYFGSKYEIDRVKSFDK